MAQSNSGDLTGLVLPVHSVNLPNSCIADPTPNSQLNWLALRAVGFVLGSLCLLLLGCSPIHVVSGAPVGIALLRSPITFNAFRYGYADAASTPLKVEDRKALSRIDDAIGHGGNATDDIGRENTETRNRERTNPTEGQNEIHDEFEGFASLKLNSTLAFVTVSGGGARAGALAAHTMSLLEQKYNEIDAKYLNERGQPPAAPLASAIDAFSSVSGGSIYSFNVALAYLRLRSLLSADGGNDMLALPPVILDNFFQDIVAPPSIVHLSSPATTLQYLGFWTGVSYLIWPPQPILTFFTNISYLEIFAQELDLLSVSNFRDLQSNGRSEHRWHWLVMGDLNPPICSDLATRACKNSPDADCHANTEKRCADILPPPLFLFNTTALETGTPLVITQRMLHTPSERLETPTARFDLECADEILRPLQHAITLEEINLSPAQFPIALAAMTSAAFPIGMEPLPVRKFGYIASFAKPQQQLYPTESVLHLTDGGVFDNSGLFTAVDLFDYLNQKATPNECKKVTSNKKLILLSINAENEQYDPGFSDKVSSREPWYDILPLIPNLWPIRQKALGYHSLDLIHYTNKRRGEQIAIARMRELNAAKDKQLFFFPVNLSQLSDEDPLQIKGGQRIFDQLKTIPTDYAVTTGEDALLAEAARMIVTSPQREGWDVGPECDSNHSVKAKVYRLDEAYAFAMLRKAKGWDVPLINSPTSYFNRWCTETSRTRGKRP